MAEAFLTSVESEYGYYFTSAALGCITAAKYGVTEVELLEIMASDEEVREYCTRKGEAKKKKIALPGRESNPGLPRDRRRYLPLYYRGLA